VKENGLRFPASWAIYCGRELGKTPEIHARHRKRLWQKAIPGWVPWVVAVQSLKSFSILNLARALSQQTLRFRRRIIATNVAENKWQSIINGNKKPMPQIQPQQLEKRRREANARLFVNKRSNRELSLEAVGADPSIG